MSLTVHLLGRPRLERPGCDVYRFRSRKSWALLAYLIDAQRPPTRSQLASLLFSEADDPLRALRWNLSELRRGLGDGGSVDGDPVVLRLGTGTAVDVEVLSHGTWAEAVEIPGLGSALLEDLTLRGAPVFESWLLAARRRVAAATEAILHEAALGSMSHGRLGVALGHAVRASEMSPFDENHHALVVRLHGMLGRHDDAARYFEACRTALADELGVGPGPVLEAAMLEARPAPVPAPGPASVEAMLEAGSAAVSAGATDAGIRSLRSAVRLADAAGLPRWRVDSRLVLAEALIHSLRGFDEEGLVALHEVEQIAASHDLPQVAVRARAELGYVNFLRARYDRAGFWLSGARRLGIGSALVTAKVTTYLGAVESDRANYPRAAALLEEGVRTSREASDLRQEAFALSMLGRVHLLRGELDRAEEPLDLAIELAGRDHWLAFVPWPQALRGEIQLRRGDRAGASRQLEQAFARACQLGDPCWEGMSARGLALLADSTGNTARAFDLLVEARERCNRLADPYVWLDAYILDSLCSLGVRHGHPGTREWLDGLTTLASRTGMQELTVRALLHAAALGTPGSAEAAVLLAADVDSPALRRLVTASCIAP